MSLAFFIFLPEVPRDFVFSSAEGIACKNKTAVSNETAVSITIKFSHKVTR